MLVVCYIYLLTLLTNVSAEANSVDQDQTAPDMGLHCFTKRLLTHFSRQQKQTTCVEIGSLRVPCQKMVDLKKKIFKKAEENIYYCCGNIGLTFYSKGYF